jgi:hypothetical protein
MLNGGQVCFVVALDLGLSCRHKLISIDDQEPETVGIDVNTRAVAEQTRMLRNALHLNPPILPVNYEPQSPRRYAAGAGRRARVGCGCI